MHFNHLLDYRPLTHLSQMNDAERAALCAEVLDHAPSEKTWKTLLELFAMWPPNEARTRYVDLAEQRLASWDDSLRRVDSSWNGLYEGERLSRVACLVKAIEIYRRDERGTAELSSIANSECAARLTSLSIFKSEIGQRAWQAVAQSPFFGELRHVHVTKTVLGNTDLAILFQSSSLSRLQCLKLIDVGLSPKSLPSIPSSLPFPSLQRIDLSGNALGNDGAALLAESRWLAGIRVLRLRHNYIAAAAMRALLESPFCRELEEIDLSDNPVTDAEKTALLGLAAREKKRLLI